MGGIYLERGETNPECDGSPAGGKARADPTLFNAKGPSARGQAYRCPFRFCSHRLFPGKVPRRHKTQNHDVSENKAFISWYRMFVGLAMLNRGASGAACLLITVEILVLGRLEEEEERNGGLV